MAKLKLPFELEKPSSNEYVTKASEVGFLGRPLSEFLNSVKDMFIDDETGDICFVDGNNYIIFKLSSNGAEAKQFRVLNSSGELIGTIDSAFFQAVLKSSDVINNLTSSATNKPLSANQGKVLKELIDSLSNQVKNIPAGMFVDDETGNTNFVDANGNILLQLSSSGANIKKLNICNSNGEVVGSIDKNLIDFISSLSGLEGIVENLIINSDGNTYFADRRGNIAFSIDNNGVINFKSFGQDLSRSLARIISSSGKTLINCWGDSLTAGAGRQNAKNKSQVVSALVSMGYDDVFTSVPDINYPTMIQLLLGSEDYEVINCGVGGETINTIMSRMGASLSILPSDVTIPTSTDAVLIAEDNLISEYDRVSAVKPLLQGAGNSVNPCNIEGVVGNLSVTFDTGYTNVKYYFTRQEPGRSMSIPQYTPIIMKGSSMSPKGDITILWCWQNGGYTDFDELIDKLHLCIRKLNNNNFVIVSLHTGTQSNRNVQETALEREFGDHFFNWRRYVSTNALYDFGITPTTDSDFTQEQLDAGVKSDTYQMSVGALPSSLWAKVYGIDGATANDMIHINSAGYMILGFKLVERLKLIGAI